MNKKLLILVLLAALLFVAFGAVSATNFPGNVINMQLDTTQTLLCQGGYLLATVDNNNQPTVAQVTCYSFYPPRPSE